METEDTSKDQLNQIRWLSDDELVKFLKQVNDVGWRGAQETLRLMVADKQRYQQRSR